MNSTSTNPGFVTPLRNGHRLSIVAKSVIGSCVIGLLLASCPSTVIRRVVAVVVDAVDRVLVTWTTAHVGVEILELQPTLADLDAATAVVSKRCISAIIASANKSSPNSILGRSGKPVSRKPERKLLAVVASAANDSVRRQIRCFYHHCSSAIAFALPVNAIAVSEDAPDYRQASESFTG